MKTIVITLLVLLGCVVVGGALFIWSGVYDVSARVPHWKLTFMLLEATREQSVSAHSRGLTAPPLGDPARIKAGFPHFHEMCRLCHRASGYHRVEFAEGLYPRPPHLASHEIRNETSDAELFWIVQNGLKMTGMPAFGGTHTPEQIWSIVAFVRKLPQLNAASYKEMVESRERSRAIEKTVSPPHLRPGQILEEDK